MQIAPKPGEIYRTADHFWVVENVDEHMSVKVSRINNSDPLDVLKCTLGSQSWEELMTDAVRVEEDNNGRAT